MSTVRVLLYAFALATVVILSLPALVLAQDPVAQPPEFVALRERFEGMTRADWEAAGYQVIPPGDCIASPAGAMGVHAIHPQLHQSQFGPAQLDPLNPPLLLLDATMTRVIGLEWEEANVGQEAPTAFGQTVPLLPGHPGILDPHYMLHAYFRPNGEVLFAEFDPLATCLLPSTLIPSTSMIATDEGPPVISLLGLGLLGAAVLIAVRRSSPGRTASGVASHGPSALSDERSDQPS